MLFCRIRKEIPSGPGAFLGDEDFIACSTSSKVVKFHAIVSESSGFKAVGVDSGGGGNIAFKKTFWIFPEKLFQGYFRAELVVFWLLFEVW